MITPAVWVGGMTGAVVVGVMVVVTTANVDSVEVSVEVAGFTTTVVTTTVTIDSETTGIVVLTVL